MLARFKIDAVAVVAHPQAVLALAEFALQPQLRLRLGLHGIQGIADQVDQDLLQAGLVDLQGLLGEVAVQLQGQGFEARIEHLQGCVNGLVQAGLALVVATAGEGAQAGGDAAHAVDQFIDGLEVGAGGVQGAAFEEAHGVAGQGTQGCQGLVQFVGDAGGHLADGRQLAGLDQFVLGAAQGFLGLAAFADLALEPFVAGPQVGGAFGDPPFQLAVGFLQGFTGGQASGDDLAPFVPGDQQKGHQGKGHRHQDALVDGFAAQVLQRGEQGEVPGGIAQGPGLGQVADGFLVGHQFGVGRKGQLFHAFGQAFPGQGFQFVEGEPVILQAAGQAFLGVVAERADRLEAARRVAGQDDDAVFVADEGFQAGTLPAFLQGLQAYLDHRHADDLALFFQAMGQVVARFAVGAADAVEAPGLAAHGVLVVGPERQVFAQVAVDVTPVAGGYHPARGVHDIDGPAAAAAVQAFEVLIDGLPVFRRRIAQQLGNTGFQFQQAWQIGVLADLTFYGAGMQLQLALAVFAEGADAVVLADPEPDVAQADHQQDDQGRQEQMSDQAGFHGE